MPSRLPKTSLAAGLFVAFLWLASPALIAHSKNATRHIEGGLSLTLCLSLRYTNGGQQQNSETQHFTGVVLFKPFFNLLACSPIGQDK